ncbi:MAG: hypothetical protein ACXWIU_00530 [Limisphaerales bacterium]
MVLSGRLSYADTRSHAVELWASIQESPPQITIQWRNNWEGLSYYVQRKSKADTQWTAVATLNSGTTSFTDSNVTIGSAYEYSVIEYPPNEFPHTGYIFAGIRAPLQDQRGKIILLVDNTYTSPLATELARLQQDLTGDGWIVLRHDVSRTDTPPHIKSVIQSDYNADPQNVQALFILGHVPVPYSGDYNADDHLDHTGAWVADPYYGDINGTWTDNSVWDTSATRAANRNTYGDGKFDQTLTPGTVRLEIGRVDLSNLPAFAPLTDIDLTRAYLNKDHAFRTGALAVQKRSLLFDDFGEAGGEAYAASGWRNFAPLLGPSSTTEIGENQFFNYVGSQDYLWSYACGGGDPNYTDCYNFGETGNFVSTQCKTVFLMFFGSYFGDWDATNDIFRASLGSGDILTVAWAGRPHWFFHHMGLGETIGYSARLVQNNTGLYQPTNFFREVHISLLGDPTLRMQIVQPASALSASTNGAYVNLKWNVSPDSSLLGYHVYRASNANGPFARLTAWPSSALSFQDAPGNGAYTYMVRAIKLESGYSGTFTNASEGVFITATLAAPTTPVSISQPQQNGKTISFVCSGQPGQKFTVERSPDLHQWTVIATNVLVGSSMTFTDTQAENAGGFYRTQLAQ